MFNLKLIRIIAVAFFMMSCSVAQSLYGVQYGKTAKVNYLRGVSELKSGNFNDAAQYFEYIKIKFPYSRYSVLAELALADSLYSDKKWLEAIDTYRLFIKFHPTHKKVLSGYAAYRIGSAYVEQIPDDWFLIPPGYEKDQNMTLEALSELRRFIKDYPNSWYLPKVKKLLVRCVKRDVDHELYVAQFYLKRDKPRAAALRYEGLIKKYPDLPQRPAYMVKLAEAYIEARKFKRARTVLNELLSRYPNDGDSRSDARALLAEIGTKGKLSNSKSPKSGK